MPDAARRIEHGSRLTLNTVLAKRHCEEYDGRGAPVENKQLPPASVYLYQMPLRSEAHPRSENPVGQSISVAVVPREHAMISDGEVIPYSK